MNLQQSRLLAIVFLALALGATVAVGQQGPPAAPQGAGGSPPQGAGAAPAGRAQGAAAPGRGAGALTLPEGAFMFVQLSDTQFGFSNNDLDFVQDTASAEFAIASVNRLKPSFVVVTGDLVNKPGDAAQIAEYERIMGKLDRAIPLYSIPGNHDIENEPTPQTVAAYRARFGRDYFTFRFRSLAGIVLNSTLIHSPQKAEAEYAEQDRWLKSELARVASSGARHTIVFQHHPWFLEKADEPDSYYNIPLARRPALLTAFREAGIKVLVSGHLHRSTEATDAGLQSIVTGPVGRPLGGQSGIRIFVVTDTDITSRYYGFGEIPYRIGPGRGATPPR